MFVKSLRRFTFATIYACCLTLILTLGTRSFGQSDSVDIPNRSTIALQEEQKNPAATRLARERYELLHRLAPKFDSPIYHAGFYACFALFPFGRADRVYVIVWNAYWPKPDGGGDDPISYLLCYQRLNNKDKLVYRVRFDLSNHGDKSFWPEAGKLKYLRSVKDYFVESNVPFAGKISKYAKSDLESPREYAYYNYWMVPGALKIMSLSNYLEADQSDIEAFNLAEDPSTHEKLKYGEFYKKYGMPVSLKEWAALKSANTSAERGSGPTP